MTKIARLIANQAVMLEDFDHLSQFPQDNLDAVIATAIEPGSSYAGGEVIKTGVATVKVAAPSYLYRGGRLFSSGDEPVEIDLLAHLPTSGNRRIIAILIQGHELLTNSKQRKIEFEEKDPLTNQVKTWNEIHPTATVSWRRATIVTQPGEQAPAPIKPVVDLGNVIIAWVVVSATGIEHIEQNLKARINPSSQVAVRTGELERWSSHARPVIDGLRSDVAKLVDQAKAKTDRGFTGYMLEQLARLNEQVGVEADASFAKTDFYLDVTDSDVEHVKYVAKIEEGLRFADDNADRSALELATPGDTHVVVHPDGLLLPRYHDQTVLSVLGKDSEVAVSNAGSQTVEYQIKTISRTRIRYGNSQIVCTNSQWWQSGRYDSVKGIFEREGEKFTVEFAAQHSSGSPSLSIKRLRKFWEDSYEEPYWEAVTVAASYTGNVSANTFQMPRSSFVTKVRLGFSRVDSGGDVRVLLCETNQDGSPNYQRGLSNVTLDGTDLKVYPELTEFNLKPTLLEGGKRYAWALITAGNHWLAMVEGNRFAQGTFFTSTDGVWSQGNLAQDACFELVGAQFETPRLTVNLNDFNLSGGITDIDLDLEQIAPEGTGITYEVQINNTWTPLQFVASGNHPLYGLPAAVNARMVLLGSSELMPAINIRRCFRRLSRPRDNARHISKARTAPAEVSDIRVSALLEHYREAEHDCAVTLLIGKDFSTEINPSSVADQRLSDGSTRRVWTFTTPSPIQSWKRQTILTTSSALSVFLVSEQTDVALPT